MHVTSQRAFTLVEIMIVIAIVGLLAAIAIPNFMRVRETTQTNACIHNLRLIDAAKQQWALEYKQLGSAEPVIDDISEYLVRANQGRVPVCPTAGSGAGFDDSYALNAVTNAPTCKILPAVHVLEF